MKSCPNCNGTKFVVYILATQEYDGSIDHWADCIVASLGEEHERALCCENCQMEWRAKELKSNKAVAPAEQEGGEAAWCKRNR